MWQTNIYTDAAYTKTHVFVAAVIIDPELGNYALSEVIEYTATSSCEAEYLGLIFGIKQLLKMHSNRPVKFLCDNDAVVNQIKKLYAVKSKDLLKVYNAAEVLWSSIPAHKKIVYILGKLNLADRHTRSLKRKYIKND